MAEEDRLTALCKSVSTEKNTEKLASLIQELSRELELLRNKRKQPQGEKPRAKSKRAGQA